MTRDEDDPKIAMILKCGERRMRERVVRVRRVRESKRPNVGKWTSRNSENEYEGPVERALLSLFWGMLKRV
jgi:hypothetical protein